MDEWHWVKGKDDEGWFPAKRDPSAAGGWTNGDTWEDFEGRIAMSIRIPSPGECLKIENERKFSNLSLYPK